LENPGSPDLPHPPREPGCKVTIVTITDIGILLIVLCVALWAIAAALHRHTVQLEALKSEMQALLKARETGDDASATPVDPTEPRNRMESAAAHTPANAASKLAAKQTLLK
jgi:hypothetical protein